MNDNYIRIIDTNGVVRIVGIAPPAPKCPVRVRREDPAHPSDLGGHSREPTGDPLQPRIGEALPTR